MADSSITKHGSSDSITTFLSSLPLLKSVAMRSPSLDNDRFFQILIAAARDTHTLMQRYDGSHDWSHIERVMSLASDLYISETKSYRAEYDDPWLILFAALMHDIHDKKYRSSNSDERLMHPARHILESHGRELFLKKENEDFPDDVINIIEHVSYSREVEDPNAVQEILEVMPELAIVQDADRLEALGAVGIGRTFTFGGAKQPDRGMQGTLNHFEEKLFKLEGLMKTKSGKVLAKARTARMRVFVDWWMQETAPQRLH